MKDGVLTITARKEQWPNPLYKDRHLGGWYRQREFAKYTSADIQSVRTFHYGRVEFRAQMPGGWGAWPALWFLGDNLRLPKDDPKYLNWPACGEIDLVEIWGNNPTRVAACLHTADRGPNPGEKKYKSNEHHKVTGGGELRANKPGMEPWNGFHTYTLDWYEDRLYMFYDGKLYADINLSRSDWPDGQKARRAESVPQAHVHHHEPRARRLRQQGRGRRHEGREDGQGHSRGEVPDGDEDRLGALLPPLKLSLSVI